MKDRVANDDVGLVLNSPPRVLPPPRPCECDDPSFARCNPVSLGVWGVEALDLNSDWIGRFVCFNCGGVADTEPAEADHITGGTVMLRLHELFPDKDAAK